MSSSELLPAGIAAIATAVFVHLRKVRSRRNASIADHLDVVLVAAAAMFLLVMLIQHPEWLAPVELG